MKFAEILSKPVVFLVFLICVFLFTTSVSFLGFSISKATQAPLSTPGGLATPLSLPLASASPRPERVYTVLLIGYGGINHSGGGLADVLMLSYVNLDTKKSALISIPRDTWIQNQKINNIFAAGGSSLIKQSVASVTGLPVDYYIAIDFSGFERAIDVLGGVDVAVPATFDDYFYPIKGKEEELCGKSPQEMEAIHATMSGYLLEQQFTCRYEHLHFDRGLTHMDGKMALKFVRSRHSDVNGGDFSRSLRQQALLTAVKNEIISIGALRNAVPFFNQFKNMIRTDINEDVINFIIPLIGDPNAYSQNFIGLTTDNVFNNITTSTGAYALTPKAGNENWSQVQQYIKQQLLK